MCCKIRTLTLIRNLTLNNFFVILTFFLRINLRKKLRIFLRISPRGMIMCWHLWPFFWGIFWGFFYFKINSYECLWPYGLECSLSVTLLFLDGYWPIEIIDPKTRKVRWGGEPWNHITSKNNNNKKKQTKQNKKTKDGSMCDQKNIPRRHPRAAQEAKCKTNYHVDNSARSVKNANPNH